VKPEKLIYFLFLTLIFQFSCTRQIEKEVLLPDDLIPKEEMVNIIVDLRLYDAIIKTKQRKAATEVNFYKYYLHNSILEKYDITRESFEHSLTYYLYDVEVMDEIYADAITKLSKMKSEAE